MAKRHYKKRDREFEGTCKTMDAIQSDLKEIKDIGKRMDAMQSSIRGLEARMATKEDVRRVRREFRGSPGNPQQVSFTGERYTHGGIGGFYSDPNPKFLYEKPYP